MVVSDMFDSNGYKIYDLQKKIEELEERIHRLEKKEIEK